MAKATKKKEPAPVPKAAEAPVVSLVDYRLIDEDPNQPRKQFEETSLQEMAADIKKNGIIQPITVRPNPDKKSIGNSDLDGKMFYTIVCGERRYRAAIMAELTEIPCIIRELTYDEALDLQISENLHRKDINPMEESDAFARLVSRGFSTPEQIADKLGVSTKYVYDRLIMQNVIDNVKEAVRTGRLGISHAKQFARLPLADQEKLWEYEVDEVEGGIDVNDLRGRIINLFRLKLENAIFDTTSKTLVKKAGACNDCQHRTGCRMVLFEDFKQDDLCLKQECWDGKVEAHIEKTIVDLQKKGKKVFLLTAEWSSKEGYVGQSDWKYLISEDEDDKPVETEFVGIIRNRSEHSDQQLGEIIYLTEDPIEKKKKEDEEDDDDDTPAVRRQIEEERKSDPDRILATRIADSFIHTYMNFANLFEKLGAMDLFINDMARKFNSLDEDFVKDILVDKLNLVKVIDNEYPDEVDYAETIKPYLVRLAAENPLYLIHFNLLIDKLDDIEGLDWGFDVDELRDIKEALQPALIDVYVIAKDVEKETGHTFPELELINQPKEAAEA